MNAKGKKSKYEEMDQDDSKIIVVTVNLNQNLTIVNGLIIMEK